MKLPIKLPRKCIPNIQRVKYKFHTQKIKSHETPNRQTRKKSGHEKKLLNSKKTYFDGGYTLYTCTVSALHLKDINLCLYAIRCEIKNYVNL